MCLASCNRIFFSQLSQLSAEGECATFSPQDASCSEEDFITISSLMQNPNPRKEESRPFVMPMRHGDVSEAIGS